MSAVLGLLRRQLTGVIALVVLVSLFFAVKLPTTSASAKERHGLAVQVLGHSLAMPSRRNSSRSGRSTRRYQHIDAWISSVGAGVAMNDLDGDRLRQRPVRRRPAHRPGHRHPGHGQERRPLPGLRAGPDGLPVNAAMAPMGCVPGDYNADGRMDLLVYCGAGCRSCS